MHTEYRADLEGPAMTAMQMIAALLALGLLVYLAIALLLPERFQ